MDPDPKMIIAIGDLHGHYPALNSLIDFLNKKYNLISDSIIRKDALLISTGDSIDRGHQALKIIDYFMKLGVANPDNFKALMGNHELLALENLDEARRMSRWDNPHIDEYLRNRHGFNGGLYFLSEFGTDTKSDVNDILHNYVVRMSKTGDIGHWIRGLLPKYEAKMGDKKILFVHAGIPESLRDRESLDEYVVRYRDNMCTETDIFGGSYNKYSSRIFVSAGLFWDRSLSNLSKGQIDSLMKNLEVDFMVTGHTPHDNIMIYGDRLIDIDVGMCPVYGENTPAALVIDTQGIRAEYVSGKSEKLSRF